MNSRNFRKITINTGRFILVQMIVGNLRRRNLDQDCRLVRTNFA